MNWPKGIRYRYRMPFFMHLYFFKQKAPVDPFPPTLRHTLNSPEKELR